MRQNKNPELNARILARKVAEFDAVEGPRVGDWLRLPDGSYARLAEVNESYFQLGLGSYHFYGPSCDFSGSFHFACPPVSILCQTGETRPGRLWFFNGDEAGPDNGVDFEIDFRVFAIREDRLEQWNFDDWEEWVGRTRG